MLSLFAMTVTRDILILLKPKDGFRFIVLKFGYRFLEESRQPKLCLPLPSLYKNLGNPLRMQKPKSPCGYEPLQVGK